MAILNNPALFNGNDITAIPGLSILATDPYKPAKRKLTLDDLARTNKASLSSAFYDKKDVTLRIAITRTTRALVEQSYEALLAIVQSPEKSLVVPQSGGLRRYTATYADTVFITSGGSYLEFNLVFTTSDHFGYDTNDSLLLQVSSYTSATKTDLLSFGGNAQWQVPVITYTLLAVNGGASKTVSFGNDNTGQTVSVTRTWTVGDVLEIDALNQTIKVNGTEVAFSGGIPEFNVGNGYLTYADNFTTSRTVSYNVNYKRRFV